MKSFLQTKDWLEFQQYIGRKVWRFDDGSPSQQGYGGGSKIRANIIEHNLPFGRNYLYIPHGPEILFDNIQGGLKNEISAFLNYLKNLARGNNSIFVKIEPLADTTVELLYNSQCLQKSNKAIQPLKTVVLNLDLSKEELLSRMHQKTRYNIKVAEKNGIVVKDSNDLDAFWNLLDKTTKRDRFASHPKVYYQKLLEFFDGSGGIKADLVMAGLPTEAGLDAKAGALVLTHGDTCYYLHGASDYDARRMMAPYALHWENIKCLKERGIKYYDLWGIDVRHWPGVTRFKLGWGGREVEHPGSFDLPISKYWYLIYKIARKIF